MLVEVAQDVLVHQSEFCQSNTVLVRGGSGLLLIDPGVHGFELAALADDLGERGERVAVGFSTHPHWDHLLWHERLGSVPRFGTQRCATTARARHDDARQKAARLAQDVSLELLGAITALPPGTTHVPWDGPRVLVIEHQGHAPGHAALLVEDRGVLVAGDMLSDVEIPLLDLLDRSEALQDYDDALQLMQDAARGVGVVVPGHGSLGWGGEVRRRLDQDRAYVAALHAGRDPQDPRVGPSAVYGQDWLPEQHRRQFDAVTR